uniref:HAT C-terminal dimerisation domain-containing protein n=1 Tax=Ditylenchus dipsaci TaxID=166011 RepID=A0A915DH88_9BILA
MVVVVLTLHLIELFTTFLSLVKLKEALQKRFKDVLQSGEEASDPIFISSAVLDISVANLLSMSSSRRQDPRFRAFDNLKLVEVPSSILSKSAFDQESSPFGFAVKKRKVVLFNRVNRAGDRELHRSSEGVFRPTTCIKYWHNWHNEGEKFTRLAHSAKSILGVPATSACVERVFSQVTLHSSGQKNLLQRATFERKCC